MNCEKCQELLSDFLDGVLSDEDHRTLNTHLEECLSCYGTHQELDQIISFCRDHRGEYDAPPNERALWLRIRNTLESQPGAARAAAASHTAKPARTFGRLSGFLNRQWELSLPQMAAAVTAIAIVVSLATALSLRSVNQSSESAAVTSSKGAKRSNEYAAAASYPGSLDDRLKRQQQQIDYWNNRIATRKAQWNAQLREAFERNLEVLDQAVASHSEELRLNPNDEVSEEMLNAALSEKMELLREFSDL